MNRLISFEGIENFRDFGGYETSMGRVRRGLLYRSGNHASASEGDLTRLAGLRLKAIVDLRRRLERDLEPTRRGSDDTVRFVMTDVDGDAPIEWPDFLRSSDLTEHSFRSNMLEFYGTAMFMPRHLDIFSRYFHELAGVDGPLLVHCAAGKDRTGIICALTHHVLGVHRDDIVGDYLLTNHPPRIEARVPVVQEQIYARTGRKLSDAAALAAITVIPEYLECAFESMRAASGSVDIYLERSLGMSSILRARIRERLLE